MVPEVVDSPEEGEVPAAEEQSDEQQPGKKPRKQKELRRKDEKKIANIYFGGLVHCLICYRTTTEIDDGVFAVRAAGYKPAHYAQAFCLECGKKSLAFHTGRKAGRGPLHEDASGAAQNFVHRRLLITCERFEREKLLLTQELTPENQAKLEAWKLKEAEEDLYEEMSEGGDESAPVPEPLTTPVDTKEELMKERALVEQLQDIRTKNLLMRQINADVFRGPSADWNSAQSPEERVQQRIQKLEARKPVEAASVKLLFNKKRATAFFIQLLKSDFGITDKAAIVAVKNEFEVSSKKFDKELMKRMIEDTRFELLADFVKEELEKNATASSHTLLENARNFFGDAVKKKQIRRVCKQIVRKPTEPQPQPAVEPQPQPAVEPQPPLVVESPPQPVESPPQPQSLPSFETDTCRKFVRRYHKKYPNVTQGQMIREIFNRFSNVPDRTQLKEIIQDSVVVPVPGLCRDRSPERKRVPAGEHIQRRGERSSISTAMKNTMDWLKRHRDGTPIAAFVETPYTEILYYVLQNEYDSAPIEWVRKIEVMLSNPKVSSDRDLAILALQKTLAAFRKRLDTKLPELGKRSINDYMKAQADALPTNFEEESSN